MRDASTATRREIWYLLARLDEARNSLACSEMLRENIQNMSTNEDGEPGNVVMFHRALRNADSELRAFLQLYKRFMDADCDIHESLRTKT